jgi:hypothetical protein
MHVPRPVSPLSFDLIVRTLAEGFTKAHEDSDGPIMVSTNEINHYLYFAFHPLPDEAEVARRMGRGRRDCRMLSSGTLSASFGARRRRSGAPTPCWGRSLVNALLLSRVDAGSV